MTLPLWGLLQKAQDNTQTIDEAIAAAIAAHEADPEAHLGEGESLQMHKTEEVIDHPPGSLLPDKISFSDLMFETTFESLGGFTVSAGVANTSWPGATFEIFDGGGDLRTLRANMLGIIDSGFIEYNYQADSYFYVDSADDNEIIHIGLTDSANSTRYLGFKIEDGQIYGYARWSGTVNYTSSLYSIAGAELVFVRVYYDYAGGVVYFYVNGTQVGTLQPSADISTSNQWGVHAIDNGAESTVLRLFRQTISRSF